MPRSLRCSGPRPAGHWRTGALSLTVVLLVATLTAPAAAEQGRARAHARVGADRVWATLLEFQRWPAIFPGLTALCRETSAEDALLVRQVTRSFGMELVHTSRVTIYPAAHRLDLALEPSYPNGLDELESAWIITPRSDGSSEIELRLSADLAVPIPGFLKRSLLRSSVEDSVAALAAAAEHRPARRSSTGPSMDSC